MVSTRSEWFYSSLAMSHSICAVRATGSLSEEQGADTFQLHKAFDKFVVRHQWQHG